MGKNGLEKDRGFAEVDLFGHFTEEQINEMSIALGEVVFRSSISFVDFRKITQEHVYLLVSRTSSVHLYLDMKEATEAKESADLTPGFYEYHLRKVSRETALEMQGMTEHDRRLICEMLIGGASNEKLAEAGHTKVNHDPVEQKPRLTDDVSKAVSQFIDANQIDGKRIVCINFFSIINPEDDNKIEECKIIFYGKRKPLLAAAKELIYLLETQENYEDDEINSYYIS